MSKNILSIKLNCTPAGIRIRNEGFVDLSDIQFHHRSNKDVEGFITLHCTLQH